VVRRLNRDLFLSLRFISELLKTSKRDSERRVHSDNVWLWELIAVQRTGLWRLGRERERRCDAWSPCVENILFPTMHHDPDMMTDSSLRDATTGQLLDFGPCTVDCSTSLFFFGMIFKNSE
jgi:hypothetical protein